MTQEEARQLQLGLYRLHWDEGGTSLAAVGMCYDGSRWFAPVNWTCRPPKEATVGKWPVAVVATTDWSRVLRADKIEV